MPRLPRSSRNTLFGLGCFGLLLAVAIGYATGWGLLSPFVAA
jgi:hypothetical protein